jgi:hypothetical protein
MVGFVNDDLERMWQLPCIFLRYYPGICLRVEGKP